MNTVYDFLRRLFLGNCGMTGVAYEGQNADRSIDSDNDQNLYMLMPFLTFCNYNKRNVPLEM